VIRFLLVCEGSSDIPLASHIQRLLDTLGHHHVDFDTSTRGRFLVDKVRNGLELAPYCDLLFVHRDADNAGPDSRYREIESAVQDAQFRGPRVGIVPVRMTEAWLLLDQTAIRKAVRKPNGRGPISLPSPTEVERRADPRAILNDALRDASETHGRRRERIEEELPALRSSLLENLPVGGQLEQLASWTRFRDDSAAALNRLSN
jgi:hypothetical protein